MLGHRAPRRVDENVDETNAVNKSIYLVPRFLSSEEASDQIDHVLQSDWGQ